MTHDELPADVQDAGRDLPPVLTLAEAAEWSKRSRRTLTRAAAKGELRVRRGSGRGESTVTRLALLTWYARYA